MIWQRYDKEQNTDVFICPGCGAEMSGTFPRECVECGHPVTDVYEIVQLAHKNTVMYFINGAPVDGEEMSERLSAEKLQELLVSWYNAYISRVDTIVVERHGILARQSAESNCVTLEEYDQVVRVIYTDGRRRTREELLAYIDNYVAEKNVSAHKSLKQHGEMR